MSTAVQHTPTQVEELAPLNEGTANVPHRVVRADWQFAFQIFRVASVVLAFDVLAILASCGLSLLVMVTMGYQIPVSLASTCLTLTLLSQLLGLWISELYPPVGVHPAIELKRMTKSTFLVGLAVTGCAAAFLGQAHAIFMIAGGFALQLISLPLFRSVARSVTKHAGLSIPFFFLGDRDQVLSIYKDMQRFGFPMLKPAGRFEDLSRKTDFRKQITIEDRFELDFERDAEYLGGPQGLASMAEERNVYWLLRVPDGSRTNVSFPREVLLSETEKQASSSSSLVSIGMANGVHSEDTLLISTQIVLKRVMDLAIASLACLCLLPVFGVIAVLIRLSGRGNILFASPRVGKDGRVFRAWKFRSMVDNADEVLRKYLDENPELKQEYALDHKLKYDPRITTVGRILRKTSLDELPQLFNVLKGEMSLVGPRPMLESERHKYGPILDDYLRVTPGITGLWQISGRNNTSYDDRLKYVRIYVRDWSPWLDLYILMRTIKTVLLCEGAY